MTEAKVKPRKDKKGQIIGYHVDEGTVYDQKGRPKRRRTLFATATLAQAHCDAVNLRRTQQNKIQDSILKKIPELVACQERLNKLDASFTDAVDFFTKHYRKKTRPKITVIQAMEDFLAEKKNLKRSSRYIQALNEIYYPRFLEVFHRNTPMKDITAEQLTEYIHSHGRWGNNTKNNHIKNIHSLFRFCYKNRYIDWNPVTEVTKPERRYAPAGILTVDDVDSLLNACLTYEKYDRLAVYVLVLFCGVRMEEAYKMKWSDINFETEKVNVSDDIAKMKQRRKNRIEENAIAWLYTIPLDIRERPDAFIIGDGKTMRLAEEKMKWIRNKANITYPKNGARHSFGSYHLAHFQEPGLTSLMLGHIRGSEMLFNHYRNCDIPEGDAERYWNLYPPEGQQKYYPKKIKLTAPLDPLWSHEDFSDSDGVYAKDAGIYEEAQKNAEFLKKNGLTKAEIAEKYRLWINRKK